MSACKRVRCDLMSKGVRAIAAAIETNKKARTFAGDLRQRVAAKKAELAALRAELAQAEEMEHSSGMTLSILKVCSSRS